MAGAYPDMRWSRANVSRTEPGERAADVKGGITLAIRPGPVLQALLAIIAVLVLCGAVLPTHEWWLGAENRALAKLARKFHLDVEANIPTYFASLQLFAAALLLGLIAALAWRQKGRFRLHWLILALGFAYLSFNEATQLHEELANFGRPLTGIDDHAVWMVPALLLVVPTALAYVPFLLALPLKIAVLKSAAGALFLGGAMGVETFAAGVAAASPAYFLLVLLEETLEMVAIALFIFANLLYLARQRRRIGLAFAGPGAGPGTSGD